MSPQNLDSKRAPAFKEIPDEKWNDWRWQFSHRLNSVQDIGEILTLTDSEKTALGSRIFSVWISPLISFP